jgi:beta-lactamase regulating signal transducer with metallopeptidase domain
VETILEVALSNTAVAAVLGLSVACVGRFVRRPGALHLLWLLVLVKLVTPPVWRLPVVPVPVATAPERQRAVSSARPAADATGRQVTDMLFAQTLLKPPGMAPAGEAAERAILVSSPAPVGIESATESLPPTDDWLAPDPAGGSAAGARTSPGSQPVEWAEVLPSLGNGLLLVWAAGTALWIGLAGRRVVCFLRMLRLAEPAPVALAERVRALASELGLCKVPEVRLVAGCLSPCVWALVGRPILVLPEELWGRLDADQQGSLLLHELAHLRRRDPLVRLLELAATAAHWWNPVLWWARRGLHEAEEQSCDAWVVHTRPGSASAYAKALVETLDFLSGSRAVPSLRTVPLGASGLGRLRHVSRRITMVMKARPNPAPGWLGGMLALGLGMLLLPLWPTWARPQVPSEPAPSSTPALGLRFAAGAPAEPTAIQDPNGRLPGSAASPASDDDIELARTAVEIQQGRLKKAEAVRRGKMAPLARMTRSNERVPNSHSREELAEAQAEVDSAEADVDIARAELKQAELKLARAMRTTAVRARPTTPLPATATPARRGMAEVMQKQAVRRVESPAQDAERIRAINSLKQLLLALHNYQDANGHFPPVATRTRDGKPALSWRVLVLPYLEQNDLFNQFHLDEPWDSEHNRPLIGKMPELFRSHDAAQGDTRFRAVGGERTIWGKPEGASMVDITDGTSNTVALIESKHVIPWTAPDESTGDGGDAGSAHPEIRQILEEGVIAGMADGSVRALRPRTFDDWKALCSRAWVQSVNNLKQIAVALHNYASEHDGRFPPIATGSGNNPHLSWRVLILPYLGPEAEALFHQFKLDEPWDSPTNKPLIQRMPQLYGTPGDTPGDTRYKGLMGPRGQTPGTFWDYPEGVRVLDITDGTSNTITVVEGLKPIAWSKPEDIALEQHSPELEAMIRQHFFAALADGSVRNITCDAPDGPSLIRALVTRNGGEVIDWSRFEPSARATTPSTNPRPVSEPTPPSRRPVAGDSSARPATPRNRAEAINSLKQIMLALHNYASTHDDRFPPIATDSGNRRNLSWRVLILPYLGQDEQALYQQFKLDEPWDSPNNKRLIERMPAAFRTEGTPEGTTLFKGVEPLRGAGPATFWDYPEGARIIDITDGTSNTVAVVEGVVPVIWTKPEELALEDQSPERERLFAQEFLAAIADGSVRSLRGNPAQLRALFTRNGGELIDWNQFGAMENQNPPQEHVGGGLGGLFGGGVTAERDRRRAMMAAQEAEALRERARAETAAAMEQRLRAEKAMLDLQAQINQLRKENAALRQQLEDSRKNLERR